MIGRLDKTTTDKAFLHIKRVPQKRNPFSLNAQEHFWGAFNLKCMPRSFSFLVVIPPSPCFLKIPPVFFKPSGHLFTFFQAPKAH